MAYSQQSPNTGTPTNDSGGLNAQIEQRKIWKRGVDIYEQSSDFFAPMEGGNKRSVIVTETDTSKGKGQKIKFTNMSGFYREGKRREELFEASTDFEEIYLNEYEMDVDYLRHAVRVSDRMEEFMGMRGEIKTGLPTELGKWLGRMKTEFMFMQFLNENNTAVNADQDASDSYIFAGEKGGLDSLVSSDVLQWDEVVSMGNRMKRAGGQPALVGKSGQNQIYRNCVVATNDALYSFETDTTYKNYLKDTNSEAQAKMLFDGGYVDIRGNIVKEYVPIDHDGYGAVASPLNPKAYLGSAIPSGNDAIVDILGGGDSTGADLTNRMYFKYFPRYAFPFLDGTTLAVSGDHYALIVNPADGTSEANKWGLVKYNVNNGNKLTITERLSGAAETGTLKNTVGTATFGAGEWIADKATDEYKLGALVLPCNSSGVPFGYSLMLGANAAYRGYGKWRNERTEEIHNGGFVKDIFVTSVFGQRPRLDRKLRMPSVTVLTHALEYSGVPLPVVS